MHSASGFAHLLSDGRNPVTHFGVQPSASKFTPWSGDVASRLREVAYGIGTTQWSFAAMNSAWIALPHRCGHSSALRTPWGPCGAALHSDSTLES